MTSIYIEFPALVLNRYNGGLTNLDKTIDEEILWYIIRPFNKGVVTVDSFSIIDPKPKINEALYQFKISLEGVDIKHFLRKVLQSLNQDARGDGCTIKKLNGKILYAHAETADLTARAKVKAKGGSERIDQP